MAELLARPRVPGYWVPSRRDMGSAPHLDPFPQHLRSDSAGRPGTWWVKKKRRANL